MRLRALLFALSLSSVGLMALPSARADNVRGLRYNRKVEPALTALGGALWLTSEALKTQLASERCRWCEANALDRRVRAGLLWSKPKAAQRTSDAVAFAMLPLVAFGGLASTAYEADALDGALIDAAIVLEAVVLAADLNQLVKLSVARERPFVHALAEGEKGRTDRPADNNVSFYSGHATMAFSLAVASATTATLRGYRCAPVLWATGLPLATLAAYLRVAGDKHYLTDITVGAAVGAAFGALIPWLHARPNASTRVSVSASTTKLRLSLRF